MHCWSEAGSLYHAWKTQKSFQLSVQDIRVNDDYSPPFCKRQNNQKPMRTVIHNADTTVEFTVVKHKSTWAESWAKDKPCSIWEKIHAMYNNKNMTMSP